ncbi:molybdate ABC transporter substrate-binding protein [Pseudomonas sp. N040]|uniref:molybdate ABC transporter substrate-binding protein n=1 Tax=Pseudomonas sp. N040 TaxID=2785325 RepID=UPI0018A31274|nr:molybdate ABC transporter substrate-binding protein [Pseudomonas sp. N040]MBF7729732.1 molybdate ABC transporter substrate-binding protein [Pseudomonas sp. N040]MBW7013374.1 molybdate ABC transporter substrate-binding protein [Pseudomonas sp. N040]
MLRQLLIGVAMCLSLSARANTTDQPLVAAAADLQFALTEVARHFESDTGHSVRLVFGSSGNFYRQIRAGAPFQLYLSADEHYVEQLAREGKTQDQGTLYALGRIVLFAPNGSGLQVDSQLKGLTAALASGAIQRFAIANPQHAPYGQRAEEALRHAGLWEALQGKLVLGENVAQAAQFATSGNAQGGIIAYSLALSPTLAKLGETALIPEEWHQPLRQRMVLLKDAGDTCREFYRYLQEPRARGILRTYGFSVPDQGQ